MKLFRNIVLFFTLLIINFSALSNEVTSPDKRVSLDLTATEEVEFLSEMRQMLTSIQGILEGIGEKIEQRS